MKPAHALILVDIQSGLVTGTAAVPHASHLRHPAGRGVRRGGAGSGCRQSRERALGDQAELVAAAADVSFASPDSLAAT